MICYRDMTFCNNPNCACPEWRRLTPEVWKGARAWWGDDNPPVCMGDICKTPPPASDRALGEVGG